MISTFSLKELKNKLMRKSNKELSLIFLFMLVLILILNFIYHNVSSGGAYHLNGEYIEGQSRELFITTSRALVISFPILCLLIATVTTIFINREQPYRKRFLKGYLLTLIVVYAFLTIAVVYQIFRAL